VLLILITERGSKLTKYVFFSYLLSYCFGMVHFPHPVDSAADPDIVSSYSRTSNPGLGHKGRLLLRVNLPEPLLSAMQADSQVITVHPKLLANLILLFLFKKDSAQEVPVPPRHIIQYIAHLFPYLIADKDLLRIWGPVSDLQVRFLEGLVPAGSAMPLKNHIIANGVDEGSESLRLAHSALPPQGSNDPNKGFLCEILHFVGRQETGTQLDFEELLKIRDKVLLRRLVAVPEAVHILCIKYK